MRTFLVRGALITFFAVTGLFGSATSVQFDGMSASVQTNNVEARMKAQPPCEDASIRFYEGPPHERYPVLKCV